MTVGSDAEFASPEGPKRVRDLGDEDVIILTCRDCEICWEVSKDFLTSLTRDDTRLIDFADRHICGSCHKIGSTLTLQLTT